MKERLRSTYVKRFTSKRPGFFMILKSILSQRFFIPNLSAFFLVTSGAIFSGHTWIGAMPGCGLVLPISLGFPSPYSSDPFPHLK